MNDEALNGGGIGIASTVALVIFVVVFLGVCAWVLTRPRRKVKHWSELPLSDDPSEERDSDAPKP